MAYQRPLKVLISSLQFTGPDAELRSLQAQIASKISPLGDLDPFGRLFLQIAPSRELKIPKEDFVILAPMAAAA
jgi:hypothetical protein